MYIWIRLFDQFGKIPWQLRGGGGEGVATFNGQCPLILYKNLLPTAPELKEYNDNGVKYFTHRSCVSTYTTQTHIKRYTKKREADDNESIDDSSKRTRRSDFGNFSFQTDLYFPWERML